MRLGQGHRHLNLAGRDEIIEHAAIALDRIKAGRAAQSLILYGLRGVGKTVLLNRIRLDAEARGLVCVWVEAPEDRSLPALLAPAFRSVLLSLDRVSSARDSIQRALRALAGFISALQVKYADLQVGLDLNPEKGLADSGDLSTDLTDLLKAIGAAAAQHDTAVVLFVDELQYVADDELAALIMAFHATSQRQLPVTIVAAGLPQLIGKTGKAKSYAERLFEFVLVDRLDDQAATDALRLPAEREGVMFERAAVSEVLSQTQGYPYFLQEWGRHCWNVADDSPINQEDVGKATVRALADLDASFFRVRFDRLTPLEKRYLRAMAELGAGPHRSGDIAEILERKVTAVAPTRNSLIAKCTIYSPAHGDTAFTVPLFDGFMKRVMPEF